MTNSNLMVSISGVRGTIPHGLTLENIVNFTQAFATISPGKEVILARDSRPSGEFIRQISSGVMLALGKNVTDAGIVPTPTIKSIVNLTKSGAGLMISASHNPLEWNAFKFIGPKGRFIDQVKIDRIREIIANNLYLEPKYLPGSKMIIQPDAYRMHIEDVLKRVNVGRIRKKKFSVFVDAVNGAGSEVIPELLKSLGCKVIAHNCEPNGLFPRPPEPTPKALVKTARIFRQSGADIGFALDPDADRLVFLSPKKGAVSEELTLPLSVLALLENRGKKGKVVVNLSTSNALKKVIEPYGHKLVRSKVGEANVVETMIREKAFFGGEGNGGVIDPAVSSFGRDSLVGIAYILDYMASSGKKFDDILADMPPVYMSKTSLPVAGQSLSDLYYKFREKFRPDVTDEKDGLWMELGDSWLHIRPSNTEPIIRVIGEAGTARDLEKLMSRATAIVE